MKSRLIYTAKLTFNLKDIWKAVFIYPLGIFIHWNMGDIAEVRNEIELFFYYFILPVSGWYALAFLYHFIRAPLAIKLEQKIRSNENKPTMILFYEEMQNLLKKKLNTEAEEKAFINDVQDIVDRTDTWIGETLGNGARIKFNSASKQVIRFQAKNKKLDNTIFNLKRYIVNLEELIDTNSWDD